MALTLLTRRLAAWILDALVLLLPFLLLDLVVYRRFLLEIAQKHEAGGPLDPRSLWVAMEPGEKGIVLVFFVVGAWLVPSVYYAFFESSRLQATPGKLALGLVVTRNDGAPISWWRSSARFWGRVLCGLIWPASLASIITILASARNQALHDMIASCMVRLRTNAGAN